MTRTRGNARRSSRRTAFFTGIAILAGILWLHTPLGAQDPAGSRQTYQVFATTEDIKVDGMLNEAVWHQPPTFTLNYETDPGDNIPAPVKTEMWVTYDRARVYVGVRAHDPQPELIRARLTDRDKAFQDDFVGVVLDTFNDERRAFEFFVNPLGVQMDLSQSDTTGNEDSSWDAIWNSAGHITDDGYEVEMAIPLSALRFPPTSSSEIWGIDALRIWPRDHRYRMGLNKLPRGASCYLCNEAKLTGFQSIQPGSNLEFYPTVTGHTANQRDALDQPFQQDRSADAGLTGRWGITPGLTLNGALNPDFSQVEADAAQLTVNTQFALFYPEKRPFFLEGADIFDTKIRAIYSRDIADPSWGVKLSGKAGKGVIGAIIARDDTTNLLFPGSQSSDLGTLDQPNTSSIFRYRYDVGSGSTMGALFTDREGAGYYNRVVGADSLMRWGNEAVRVEILGSMTAYPDSIQQDFNQPAGNLPGHSMRAVYQHRERGWMGLVQYREASDDFRADLGFIPQVGFHSAFGEIEKYWYADNNEHWWRQLTLGVDNTYIYDRQGNPLQQQVAPYLWMNGPREFFNNLYVGLGPSYYNGQRFDRNYVNNYTEVRPSGSVYLSFEIRAGQEIDYANTQQGEILRLIPGARFDLGRHLRLEATDNFERMNVRGGWLYRANVSDVRATYQFNNRTFVRLITQYYNIRRDPTLYLDETDAHDRQVFNQFLFSYKINPQVVLFLGYSDNYQNSPTADLGQMNRTVFCKVGYAFGV